MEHKISFLVRLRHQKIWESSENQNTHYSTYQTVTGNTV